MITLNFNLKDFEYCAPQADQALDQVPFALPGAMNGAVKGARQVLVEYTWPAHVNVRNTRLIGAAIVLSVDNSDTETKTPVSVTLGRKVTGGDAQDRQL